MPGSYIAEAYAIDEHNNKSKTKRYQYYIGGDILGDFGCTNPNACNYDAEAEFGNDNEYCIFPVRYYQDSDGDGTFDPDDGSGDGIGIPCGDICPEDDVPFQAGFDCVIFEAGVDDCTGSFDDCGVCNGPGLYGDCSYFTCCNDDCECVEADCSHMEDTNGTCCLKDIELTTITCYCDPDGDLAYDYSVQVGPICFPECPENCYQSGHGYWQGEFGPEIFGCTDDVACNFNPEATQDNGTCEYGQGFDDYIETIIVDTTSDIYYELFNNNLSTNQSIIPIEYGNNDYVIFQYINNDYQYVIPGTGGGGIDYPAYDITTNYSFPSGGKQVGNVFLANLTPNTLTILGENPIQNYYNIDFISGDLFIFKNQNGFNIQVFYTVLDLGFTTLAFWQKLNQETEELIELSQSEDFNIESGTAFEFRPALREDGEYGQFSF